MTASERRHQYLRDLYDPLPFLSTAVGAGIGQWRDSPKEWGQGAQGFSLRFVSGYGEIVVRETLIYGVSSALHEDNRYFRSHRTGFGPRLRYAVESSFLTRHEDGFRGVSISKMGGFAGASLISRLWQPPSTGSGVDALNNFGLAIAVSVGFNVAREFLPDLLHAK